MFDLHTFDDFFNVLIKAIEQVDRVSIDYKSLESILNSLPKDIQDTETYKKARVINGETQLSDIEWITSLGNTYVNTQKPELYIRDVFSMSSKIEKYVVSIVENNSIAKREKLIVLLAHFEGYLHEKFVFERGSIKKRFENILRGKEESAGGIDE